MHVITEMEANVDKVDEKDSFKEGFTIVNKQYKAFGWPYMVYYATTAFMTYQFIMSPLMTMMNKLPLESGFLETDTTYTVQ